MTTTSNTFKFINCVQVADHKYSGNVMYFGIRYMFITTDDITLSYLVNDKSDKSINDALNKLNLVCILPSSNDNNLQVVTNRTILKELVLEICKGF